MRVIEPGHIYELDNLDIQNGGMLTQRLIFVNREHITNRVSEMSAAALESGATYEIKRGHPGTQTQEVLRATIDLMGLLKASVELMDVTIDRTNHCDDCERWEGNDRIIKAMSEAQRQMRLALLYHEERALERKLERGTLKPEGIPTGKDGHWVVE